MEDTEEYAFIVFPSESEVDYPQMITSSEDFSSSWYQTNFINVQIPTPTSVPGLFKLFIFYSVCKVGSLLRE